MSPHAHARIKRVETAQARAADGVLAVLTGADVEADKLGALVPVMPEDMGGPKGLRTLRPLLCTGRGALWATASPSSSLNRRNKRATTPSRCGRDRHATGAPHLFHMVDMHQI